VKPKTSCCFLIRQQLNHQSVIEEKINRSAGQSSVVRKETMNTARYRRLFVELVENLLRLDAQQTLIEVLQRQDIAKCSVLFWRTYIARLLQLLDTTVKKEGGPPVEGVQRMAKLFGYKRPPFEREWNVVKELADEESQEAARRRCGYQVYALLAASYAMEIQLDFSANQERCAKFWTNFVETFVDLIEPVEGAGPETNAARQSDARRAAYILAAEMLSQT
jgi:hypothetical protein